MRLLFVARHFTYFRNFEGAIRLLAEHGHEVHLAAERDEQLGGRAMADRLAAESPRVTVGFVPPREDERWFAIATVLRRSLDHLRYVAPLYRDAPKIRERAWERTPQLALLLSRSPARAAVERALDALDRSIPVDAALDAWIAERRPDLLVVTPLIELGSPQLDIVKAARARRVPVALAVWSWDHLSSKARIRYAPERVLVWNETQKLEAVALHGIAPARVEVTGAQCFDQWFGRRPSRSREAFCATIGVPPDRALVLYVCSALFRGGPSEAEFVQQWIAHLRAADDPQVRGAAILVRPHPQRMYEWDDAVLPEGVAFSGGHPIDERGRNDYFDAMYYASAVVGLNTSALIEAAIVDRPVLTVLVPAFHGSQEGTLHFRHLLHGPSAFLIAARSLDEHVQQLGASLAGHPPRRNDAFVRAFVRPHGVGTPSTTNFVDAVEAAARLPASGPIPVSAACEPFLRAWYRHVEHPRVRALMMEAGHAAEERQRAERLEQKQSRVRAREEARRARAAEKESRYRVKRRRQTIARLKTALRRVLPAGARHGADL